MTDLLLELSQKPLAKKLSSTLKLPIPLPEQLERPRGAAVERFLEGARVAVAGKGAASATLARELARAGATTCLTPALDRSAFAGAAEAYGRPLEEIAAGESSERRFHALLFDATSLTDPDELRQVYEFFHGLIRSLDRSGRVVLLGRPAESARSLGEAAVSAALEGFTRSLAKEIGGKGATANLLLVESGAEERAAAPLRFFLSHASAFVSAQPLRVSATARAEPRDPVVRPLDGSVALVTGAARGIGAATAEVLAAEGAHVVCLDRPEDDHALAEVARKVGGSILTADVASGDAPERIVRELKDKHGGVQIVVHNAGVTRDRMLRNMPQQQWDQALGINLQAVMRITQALLDGTLRDHGRIVSLASIAGIAGNAGQTNYAASKAGLMGFTRFLSRELAPRGITVNAVAPGFIETRMTAAIPAVVRQAGRRLSALGQGGLPEDVARTIAFLATPGASGVTGQVLRICGGALIGA